MLMTNKKRLGCQDCGGRGDVFHDRIDEYTIYNPCGWCDGTGEMTPEMRGAWLRCKRDDRRKEREKELAELWRDRDRLGEAVILLKLTRDLHKVWKDILPNTGKIDEFLAAMKND